jgi:hypothetical protein
MEMSILDKAKEAAAAAAEKTRELAGSAVEVVEEAGVKAKELAHEAGAAVAEGVNTTVEKAKELASEAGDVAKGIGSAIANATVVDSAKAFTAGEQNEEAAQASEIAAGKATGDSGKG